MGRIIPVIITTSVLILMSFIFSFEIGKADSDIMKEMDRLRKFTIGVRIGDRDAYITTDYKVKFGKNQVVWHSEEGDGYLLDIPKKMEISGNIYVLYQNNIYSAKISDYRFERIMDKYNILIVLATGETLVPVKLKPSQLIRTIDGIDITEFTKTVSKKAVYKKHDLDKYYQRLTANGENGTLEFMLFFQAPPIPLIK